MTKTCAHGRISLSPVTKLRLFADSGGYCANPACLQEIFKVLDGDAIYIGEMAHIISAGNDGPRANTTWTDEERSKYENLVLLCPNCHTTIDKAEETFPESLILEWKRDHKRRLAVLFGIRKFSSRNEVRQAIEPLFLENKYVFENYGPNSDERFNPESSLPAQWRRKILEVIIPNNRKILGFIDVNRNFLQGEEALVLEAFRQHIDDFEAKHLGGSEYAGSQYPFQISKIFQ